MTTTHASTTSAPPDDPRQAERMAALLAVFHHCRPRDEGAPPALPSVFRLPALNEAVALLREGEGPLARRFRHDARTVLGEAAARHPERRDLADALARLARPAESGATPPALDHHAEVADFASHVRFDPDSHITRAEVRLRVRRALADLAVAADPRCWDVEHNPFFRRTEKIDAARFRRDGRVLVDADQPPAGRSWSGILYEAVECRQGALALARFWNLLNVDYRTTPESIDMRFSLHQSLRSDVWLSQQHGGLDVDSGYYEARPFAGDPAWTRIVAVKSVRYTDREGDTAPFEGLGGVGHAMNFLAPAIVGLWMAELTFWGACHVESSAALAKAFHPGASPERTAT